MKLTLFLLFAAIMHVSANGYGQQINIKEKNASLEKVLREIRLQSGYDFLFDSEVIKNVALAQVDLKNATIDEALKSCLKGLPLTYAIEDRTVVIRNEERSLIKKLKDNLKGLTGLLTLPSIVTGRVTNPDGEPLGGATILIKRTKVGLNADVNGIFLLKTAEVSDTLLVSFIGYKTAIIPINQRTIINVQLQQTTNGLDEVVVQAYGQTTQRLTTGNIGRLTAVEIAKQPVFDPLLALEGRIAGVVVSPLSGYDGGPVSIQIRGRNYINSAYTSDPLYIIDGVPQTILDINGTKKNFYTSGSYSPGLDMNGLSMAGGQSPLAGLNPNDIESIEVLKDADATAIYGSRGANGVILITTKKGSPSKGEFSLNLNQGVRFTTGEWDMLNTPQYLAMRREAFKNDGITPTVANAPDLLVWDPNRNTDWQKYLYGGLGQWTNLQSSISGGNAQTTYRIGGGYNTTSDITTLSGKNLRGSLSSSLVTHSANQRFTLSLSNNYSFTEMNQISLSGAATLAPNAPGVYNSQGGLNFAEYDITKTSFPFSGLVNPFESKTNTLNSSLNLSYAVFKGFLAKVNFGYNNGQNSQTFFTPIAGMDPNTVQNPKGSASFASSQTSNIVIEPQLEYNSVISKGSINVLLGGTYQSNTTKSLLVKGDGYPSDDLLHTIDNAPIIHASDGIGHYKYAGIFARINYNWENKYILNFNGRRDGSSRFGDDNRFGNFGSVGAAYILSEEKWIKDALPKAISLIKLRGSYGLTGSDGVGDYQYLTQWGAAGLPTYNGINPLLPLLHANPDFHWQVNKKLEGALDLGFWNDRINVEAAYYRDRCNNQLVAFPTPDFTGFPSVTANTPANVQNDGWEFTMNAQIFNGKHFRYSTNFNIGINRNKVLSYPDLANSPYYTTIKIGQSIGDMYVYQYTGVDPKTGQYTYLDANHDGKISTVYTAPPGTGVDDRVAIVNLTPKFTGGMSHQFNYDEFSLSFFFSFAKQMGVNALSTSNFGNMSNTSLYEYNNRWQQPGDIAKLARLTTIPQTSDINFVNSSGQYTDASYIRLQNVALGYALPPKWTKKIGIRNLSINASAQNLFVISGYNGLDPQIQSFGSMPPVRTITFGLSGSF